MALPLTKDIEQILSQARQEAVQWSHGFVGTHHALIAMTRATSNLAHWFLAGWEVTPDALVPLLVHCVTEALPPPEPTLMLSAMLCDRIARAGQMAEQRGDRVLGCEHLLLAFAEEYPCCAGAMLRACGADQSLVWHGIDRVLSKTHPQGNTPPAAPHPVSLLRDVALHSLTALAAALPRHHQQHARLGATRSWLATADLGHEADTAAGAQPQSLTPDDRGVWFNEIPRRHLVERDARLAQPVVADPGQPRTRALPPALSQADLLHNFAGQVFPAQTDPD